MFDDDQQNSGGVWDTVSNAASDVWNGASNAASDVWNGASQVASDTWGAVSGSMGEAWDKTSQGVSDTWNQTSEAVSNWWNNSGTKDEGPIVVPVTPEQEAAAAKQVEESDRLNNDPNYRNPYQQEQDRQAENERKYQERQKAKEAADPNNMWRDALDKYLRGEGPNPGAKDDYVRKVENHRQDASPSGPYSGQY